MGKIVCALHARRPTAAESVRALYDEAGWWPERRLEDIAAVLAGGPAVGAWDGDGLVGFARAVDDGRFRAYVEDVVVQRAYRRDSVASRLLGLLLTELTHVETISLFCDPALAGLYEPFGFRAVSRTEVVLHRPGRLR
jgi:GNAT superfamily N-acetyltransferase